MENDIKRPPLVSVLVACYNHENYVTHTIESIINQTYKNIELIVVDDGSTDNSHEILETLRQKYNFYYLHQKNMGLSATLNKMIKMCNGEYIAPIASDDICALDKIEILVNEFRVLDEAYVLVCGNAKFIDDNGMILDRNNKNCIDLISYYTLDRVDLDVKTDFGTYHSLLMGNYIPALSTMIKKSALIDAGLYEENIALEDWNMWLKLSKKNKMKFIDRVVAFYRWHENNVSKRMSQRLAMDVIYLLEREKDYAFSHGLRKNWEKRYFIALNYLIKNRNFYLYVKKVTSMNVISYSIFFINMIYTKIMRKITS